MELTLTREQRDTLDSIDTERYEDIPNPEDSYEDMLLETGFGEWLQEDDPT